MQRVIKLVRTFLLYNDYIKMVVLDECFKHSFSSIKAELAELFNFEKLAEKFHQINVHC